MLINNFIFYNIAILGKVNMPSIRKKRQYSRESMVGLDLAILFSECGEVDKIQGVAFRFCDMADFG